MVRKIESLAFESETLHAYLREIDGFPTLTPDDERHLARQIQQHGDEDALSRLVQSNLRFVVNYARRFRRLGVPLLDLIHEGNLALIEAARRFDPTRGSSFQASALWWIRQAVLHQLTHAARARAVTSSGLMAAEAAGRQVDAIRLAIEHAQSANIAESPKPAIDADWLTTLHEEGRSGRRPTRKTRKSISAHLLDLSALHVERRPSVLRGYLN